MVFSGLDFDVTCCSLPWLFSILDKFKKTMVLNWRNKAYLLSTVFPQLYLPYQVCLPK